MLSGSEEWSESDVSSNFDPGESVVAESANMSRLTGVHSIIHYFFTFLLLWQTAFNISNSAIAD